ncbi:hypothetical protein ACNTMW_08840 [Planosporangium sp. 12N6]|uniref:hypothetical protein n=1 Tax=Planosporangium spinosum TaxID=3402278 RepID=UPI003CF3290A
MRTTKLVVAAAGLTMGLAACSSTGSINGSASPGASGTAGASSGASVGSSAGATPTAGASGVGNPCVVGTWKTTAVTMAFDAGGARGSASGGGGALLTVAPNGSVAADFSAAQPITFTTTAAGTEVKGQFAYGGTLKGAVQVPASATPTGVWKPVGTTDWSAVTVTVEMTAPVQARLFDHAKLGDYANAGTNQSAGSVDVQPILREGTYECGSGTLKLGPPPGSTTGGTWVLQRA